MRLGPWEILLVAVVLLLLFGRKIPEMMHGLGSGIREFKKGLREDDTANNTEAGNNEREVKPK